MKSYSDRADGLVPLLPSAAADSSLPETELSGSYSESVRGRGSEPSQRGLSEVGAGEVPSTLRPAALHEIGEVDHLRVACLLDMPPVDRGRRQSNDAIPHPH